MQALQINKIKSLTEIEHLLKNEKCLTIMHCHGVFDLLHPGHIRHFKAAKKKGDRLIVTITPDRYVNKGPGRPAFTESLRLESIAALEDVDYVALNDTADAISAILKIKPSFYVKGIEYKNPEDDVTGKITEEIQAVESVGGKIFYTDDITFSSSSLLNHYVDTPSTDVAQFLTSLKQQYSSDDILKKIDALNELNILIVGDAIIDEYQFSEPMGQSGKGLHMVTRCLEKQTFLGGSLIIANHIAGFTKNVTLLTALGKECPYLDFVHTHLDEKIKPEFSFHDDATTLIKKRYVFRDGPTLTKLFETYTGQERPLTPLQTKSLIDYLHTHGSEFDLVLVCDFGNGFTNSSIIEALSNLPSFVSLNTQTNSGNRGFNAVTNYRKANYISLNELELRLATRDKNNSLETIASHICQVMNCQHLSVTRGVKGVLCYSPQETLHIPAFATDSVDRIGAGDSYLALSSLCFAKGYHPMLAAFLGSIAAAMSVQVVGNQEAIKKIPFCKFLTRLLK